MKDEAMTPQERAQVLLTARLLQAAGRIDWLSTGLTLVAAAAVAVFGPNIVAAAAAIVLGIVGKLYSVRIAFDARLFHDIAAERLTAPELDSALAGLGLRKADKAPRPWNDRCRGARRLVIVCGAITAAQAVAVILMGIA
jgi:hypothetical protein